MPSTRKRYFNKNRRAVFFTKAEREAFTFSEWVYFLKGNGYY